MRGIVAEMKDSRERDLGGLAVRACLRADAGLGRSTVVSGRPLVAKGMGGGHGLSGPERSCARGRGAN